MVMRAVRVERRYAAVRPWVALSLIPRPFVLVAFEWQTLAFEVGVYAPAREDSLVVAGIDFALSAVLADALVVVWPSRGTSRANRRECLLRLLGRGP